MEVYLINAKHDVDESQEVSALSSASFGLGNISTSNIGLSGGSVSGLSASASLVNAVPSPRKTMPYRPGKRKLNSSASLDENYPQQAPISTSQRRQSGQSQRGFQKLSPLHVDEEFMSLIEGEGGSVSEYFLGTDSDILNNLDSHPLKVISPLYSSSKSKASDQ